MNVEEKALNESAPTMGNKPRDESSHADKDINIVQENSSSVSTNQSPPQLADKEPETTASDAKASKPKEKSNKNNEKSYKNNEKSNKSNEKSNKNNGKSNKNTEKPNKSNGESKKQNAKMTIEEVSAVEAAIPENMLSPPKSETQTDETNTATSSSPASESQLSPLNEKEEDRPATPSVTRSNTKTTAATSEHKSLVPSAAPQSTASGAVNLVANGARPKSTGKPLMSALNKKTNKSAARPRKQKALVAMYESEISDNKTGIKLCIKKADSFGAAISAAASAISATVGLARSASTSGKQSRKRSRKLKTRVDSDDSEYETKRKKERAPNNNATGPKKVSFTGLPKERPKQPMEQSDWGAKMPEDLLYEIFQIVVRRDGCLPTLFRLGRVCSLWRRVSLDPMLWKTLDLSIYVKEKYRTELKLKWLVDNRCSKCTELNVSNWKISDINCFLAKLAVGCPNLVSIKLSGWKGFTSDHLNILVENQKNLERLDLSSINVEMNASKSAVGLQSLCNAVQTMNGRLTHLYLAHNRLAGIPQLVSILAAHCPNLELLDLSNVTTQATSHGVLNIEKLQTGCQKLRVLRITNSHVVPSLFTLEDMMAAPGWRDLEELSVAALIDESRIICDEHLQRILKGSSKLKLLDVRGCCRLTHESLIRLPAWDIKHLFLSGCLVTRDIGSGLELIASKWAHSLMELDLAWANVQQPLDNALRALAEKGKDSPLAHLNLCGSSVSEAAVKEILANCPNLSSINLASCRGLPRGVKRLMQGPQELQELRDVLKVEMKVKLPSELKREREKVASEAAGSSEAAASSEAATSKQPTDINT